MGADVIPVGVSPNGRNINDNCGSTHPQTAAETVVAHGADLAICLDGDADRIILVDEKGQVADGDQLMGLMAAGWAARASGGNAGGHGHVKPWVGTVPERFGHHAGTHGGG